MIKCFSIRALEFWYAIHQGTFALIQVAATKVAKPIYLISGQACLNVKA